MAACEASEVAREVEVDGKHFGSFTWALVTALASTDATRVLRWSDVWYPVLDALERLGGHQHPSQSRAWTRPLLGGPDVVGDQGFRIARDGADSYRISAGTMAGVDVNTKLAVYGADPAVFPALDGPEDHAARLGVVRVIEARGSTANARVASGIAFDTPADARARVIEAPNDARISVRVASDDTLVRAALAGSHRLRAVDPGSSADVWIDGSRSDACVLGDDLYGARDPADPRHLWTLDQATAATIVAALEHYRRYSEPLRMARRCRDLPCALWIELLACEHKDGKLSPSVAIDKTEEGVQRLVVEQPFCVRVHSSAACELFVGILCCTCDGQVEHWGELAIPPRGHATHWRGGVIGSPFVASLPPDRVAAYERIVAIGTNVAGVSFAHLEHRESFAAAIDKARSAARGGVPVLPALPEYWTGRVFEISIQR